ncbi:MAG: hypothetical protein HKM02_02575 [Pseudomonadales bacterium]|nr:hypothetical protein [Pseudomonadales bacterium]
MLHRLGIWGDTEGDRARAILAALESWENLQVVLLEEGESDPDEETTVLFRQRTLIVQNADNYALDELQALVVLRGDCQEILPRLSQGQPVLVPEGGARWVHPQVYELIAPEVDLAARVLRPMLAMGLKAVQLVSLEPVSMRGNQAVSGLVREVVDMLNGRGKQHETFPLQMAFNHWPLLAEEIQKSLDALRQCLDSQALQLDWIRLQVPVFYGLVQYLHLSFATAVSPAMLKDLLLHAGYNLDEVPGGPVEMLAREDEQEPNIHADIQAGATENTLCLRVNVDNLRFSIAKNLVEVLQKLEKAL